MEWEPIPGRPGIEDRRGEAPPEDSVWDHALPQIRRFAAAQNPLILAYPGADIPEPEPKRVVNIPGVSRPVQPDWNAKESDQSAGHTLNHRLGTARHPDVPLLDNVARQMEDRQLDQQLSSPDGMRRGAQEGAENNRRRLADLDAQIAALQAQRAELAKPAQPPQMSTPGPAPLDFAAMRARLESLQRPARTK